MAESGTLTIHLPEDQLRRLEELAETTRRSSAALAAEAVAGYLATHEAQIEAIKEGLEAVRRGDVVPHEEVVAWIESWGTDNELPRPRPRRS